MKPVAERCDTGVRVAGAPAAPAPANRPAGAGFGKWAPLARRLLEPGLAGIAVRSLFSGLLIYCIGCVIPTPLEAEPTPAAGRPLITRADKPGAFGFYSNMTRTEFVFSVAAVDDNVNEQLWLRIFHVNGTQYNPLTSAEVMLQDDVADPTKRSFTYGSNAYCCFIAGGCSGSATDQLVSAIVSKESLKTLPANLAKPELTEGTFDEKFWVMSCL